MNAISYLIRTIIDFYIILLLLRVWMHYLNCDPYNLFAQFVIRYTKPLVSQLRYFLPTFKQIDLRSLTLAYFLSALKYPILCYLLSSNMLVVDNSMGPSLFSALLIGFIMLLKSIGSTLFWLIFFRGISSWFANGYPPIYLLLCQMTEPLLAPIRRWLPDLGGIDFSPIIVILILSFLNYLGADIFGINWHIDTLILR